MTLTDEILRPLDAVCSRDNDCYSTCCPSSSSVCSVVQTCSDSRYTLIITITVISLLLIIGALVGYFKWVRDRRYDERLNSIVVKGKYEKASINEEDIDDFTKNAVNHDGSRIER